MTIYDVLKLLGGLAFFLFGLQLMTEKLERVIGKRVKQALSLMKKNRVAAILGGMAATGALQSSSHVTSAVVGLVNAGVLTLTGAMGAIMGANIGSTVTGFLLCVPAQIGLALGAAGMVIVMLFRRDRIRQAGYLLLSLGVMLGGLGIFTQALSAFKEWEGVTYLLLGMEYPLLAVLLGAGVTAILQSSAAMVGLLQALLFAGMMPLETALHLLLGANIGTTVTAVLTSSGASVHARRTAALHVLFNLIGAALFFAAMHYLPLMTYLTKITVCAKLQLAVSHAVLNVATAILLLPFMGLIVLLSRLFVRGEEKENVLAHYDERMQAVPSIALLQLDQEVQRLCEINRERLQEAIACWQGEGEVTITAQCRRVEKAISEGLLAVRGKTQNESDHARIATLMTAVMQSQKIGRHAQQLCTLSAANETFDEEAMDDLLHMMHMALNMADMAQQAIFGEKLSGEKQQSMQLMTRDMQEAAQEKSEQHFARLVNGGYSPSGSVVYLEALHHATRAAAHAGDMLRA